MDNSDLVCQILRTLVIVLVKQAGIDVIAVSGKSQKEQPGQNIGHDTDILYHLSDSTGENEPERYDTHNAQSNDTAAAPEDRIDIGHEE